jgi:HAMP domain-containing protein
LRPLKEAERQPLAPHAGFIHAKDRRNSTQRRQFADPGRGDPAMNFATRLCDLPLRTQLMLVFAFLSITTTAITTITLTTLSGQRTHAALRERSVRIARRLQQQLEPVVAFDDHKTARELFASYSGDRELDGIAVYAENGELIEGRGLRPQQLRSDTADPGTNKDHVIATAEVKSRDGRVGRLYLSFSTKFNDESQRRDIWIASGFGASIVLCAMILAVQMSRRIARRLVRIADAANRMASGDPSHVFLDDQAKDEIGALAHSFNDMVSELNRLSTEYDRLALTERDRLKSLVSERTRALEERTQSLEQSREMFRLMAESTKAIPFTLDLTRNCFPYIGAQGIANSPRRKSSNPSADLPRASPTRSTLRFSLSLTMCSSCARR